MATVKIRKSVGKGGKNAVDDVKKIQELLNKHTSAGGYGKLKVDMDCGKKTIGAISSFQGKVIGMGKPDGRVDPGGTTLKALNGKPGSVTPGSGGGSGGGTKSKPKSGGGGGSKSKGKSKGAKKGEETAEELLERFTAANFKITEIDGDIARREAFGSKLDVAEKRLGFAQMDYKAKFKLIRDTFKQVDEEVRAKRIDDVARTADDLQRAMAQVEKSGKPLDGVTVEKALAANFKALNEMLADKKTAKASKAIDGAEKKMDKYIRYALAAIKVMRAANAAIILAHKAKRKLYEASVKDAQKKLKALKKA